MEIIVEELIRTIPSDIDAFDERLLTLREKQKAIVEGAVDRLNKSVEEESKLANQTKALEAARIERTKELAAELEMENLNPKLSEIIEKVEEKYGQRLTEPWLGHRHRPFCSEGDGEIEEATRRIDVSQG